MSLWLCERGWYGGGRGCDLLAFGLKHGVESVGLGNSAGEAVQDEALHPHALQTHTQTYALCMYVYTHTHTHTHSLTYIHTYTLMHTYQPVLVSPCTTH